MAGFITAALLKDYVMFLHWILCEHYNLSLFPTLCVPYGVIL